MKKTLFLASAAFLFFNCLNIYSQVGSSPFTLETELVSMSNAPRIHSFAFAQSGGKWLFIGGRTNGLHGFSIGESFPPTYENKFIWVMDPSNGQTWSENLFSFMAAAKSDPLRSMNAEFVQSGDRLYIMGGYGQDTLKDSLVTFPVLSAVDVGETIQAVMNGTSPDSHIRQITDERMRVCGGEASMLADYYVIAGGQNFWGDYTRFGNNNQVYSNKFKKFKIIDNGTSLSISDYTDITDTVNFHRRDLNLVPSVKSDGTEGLTVYGGVFTFNDLPYQNPVYIDNNFNISSDTSYQQFMSQYHTAHIVTFDSLTNNLNTTFLGGTSLYYYNNGYIRDELVPFIKNVTTITKLSTGVTTEYVHPVQFDYYVGTNAQFILDPSVPVFDNGIIKLQNLPGRTFVGYMFGGILADGANFSTSGPSDKIYKLYITKNPIGIQPIGNQIPKSFSLHQNYPNPFNPSTKINFEIPVSGFVNITIYDLLGRKVEELVNGTFRAGFYVTEWDAAKYASGVYVYRIISGDYSDVKRMILIK